MDATGPIPRQAGGTFQGSPPPSSLTDAARTGGAVLLARQGANALFRFAASVTLARLLVPEEFGVAAMGAAFAGLPQAFGDLGLGSYLVQATSVDEDLLRRIYRLNWALALFLGAFLFGLGLLAPLFYNDPRVRGVVWLSALGFPAQALWSVHEKVLRRGLQFRSLALLHSTFALAAALLSVLLAAVGFSYWSLVLPTPLIHLLIAPLYWKKSGLGPVPGRSRNFGSAPKGLFRFSFYATGNSLITYLGNNADYLLIGRILDAASLGLYTFAYTKAFLFSKSFLSVVRDVALPAMSLAKTDPQRLKRGFQKSLRFLSLVNVPVSAFLLSAAPVLLPWVFGERWRGAVLPFQILLVHVAVNALTSPVDSALYAIGRPDLNFRVVALMVPLLVGAYAVGAHRGGIVGVAAAVTLIKSIFSLVKLHLLLRALGWSFLDTLGGVPRSVGVAFTSALAASMALEATPSWIPVARLGLCLAIFLLLLSALTFLFDREGLALLLDTALPLRFRGSRAVATLCERRKGTSSSIGEE